MVLILFYDVYYFFSKISSLKYKNTYGINYNYTPYNVFQIFDHSPRKIKYIDMNIKYRHFIVIFVNSNDRHASL
jgi:hypothetical protein